MMVVSFMSRGSMVGRAVTRLGTKGKSNGDRAAKEGQRDEHYTEAPEELPHAASL